jgi:cob(I)alamin adenosyltransferase
MRISRVYTRVGDRGTTRLVGGQEVSKDDLRIEAYGTVDELNAVMGMFRVRTRSAGGSACEEIDQRLELIQHDLFNLGGDLATPAESRWEGMYRVGDADVKRLEDWIDEWNSQLPPLKEFILPGGGEVGAVAHLGRTVCRRAERRVLSLVRDKSDVGEGGLRYLNRLSDWLFVAGRWVARAHGEPEVFWKKPGA